MEDTVPPISFDIGSEVLRGWIVSPIETTPQTQAEAAQSAFRSAFNSSSFEEGRCFRDILQSYPVGLDPLLCIGSWPGLASGSHVVVSLPRYAAFPGGADDAANKITSLLGAAPVPGKWTRWCYDHVKGYLLDLKDFGFQVRSPTGDLRVLRRYKAQTKIAGQVIDGAVSWGDFFPDGVPTILAGDALQKLRSALAEAADDYFKFPEDGVLLPALRRCVARAIFETSETGINPADLYFESLKEPGLHGLVVVMLSYRGSVLRLQRHPPAGRRDFVSCADGNHVVVWLNESRCEVEPRPKPRPMMPVTPSLTGSTTPRQPRFSARSSPDTPSDCASSVTTYRGTARKAARSPPPVGAKPEKFVVPHGGRALKVARIPVGMSSAKGVQALFPTADAWLLQWVQSENAWVGIAVFIDRQDEVLAGGATGGTGSAQHRASEARHHWPPPTLLLPEGPGHPVKPELSEVSQTLIAAMGGIMYHEAC